MTGDVAEEVWVGSYEPIDHLPRSLQSIKDVLGVEIENYKVHKNFEKFPFHYSWIVSGTEEQLDIFQWMFEEVME